MATGVTCFQWFFWGYSLTFSHSAGPFIGDLANFGFMDVLARPSVGSDKIPDILFAVYQGMFSAITVALATGAVAERGRMLPCVIFMFVWATVIYDPIACWTWNPSGWSNKMGGLDFAGGTPVHISSGSAALAYSMMLGKRRGHGTHELNYRPHNVTHIVIGTVFLWVGWFGFNAGSAFAANLRAVMAAVVTNLAACVGGMTWCILDYRLEKKWSTVGFCSGVVAGLVSITPGSGELSCLLHACVALTNTLCEQATFHLGLLSFLESWAPASLTTLPSSSSSSESTTLLTFLPYTGLEVLWVTSSPLSSLRTTSPPWTVRATSTVAGSIITGSNLDTRLPTPSQEAFTPSVALVSFCSSSTSSPASGFGLPRMPRCSVLTTLRLASSRTTMSSSREKCSTTWSTRPAADIRLIQLRSSRSRSTASR